MRGKPGEDYTRANTNDLQVGDIVIVEHKRFDYDTGVPLDSVYYRTVVGKHMTVGGMQFDLTNEPNISFPNITRWPLGWIYAGNSEVCQMWKHKRQCKLSIY